MNTATQSWSILSRRKTSSTSRNAKAACLRGALGIVALFVACVGTALAYGPYPPGTTVFVDVANTSGIESGTAAQPFNRIQEAIDAAPAGAIVGVAAGLYTGDQNEHLVISKPLDLIGYDTATTVIQDQPLTDDGDAMVRIGSQNVVIESGNVRIAALTIEGLVITDNNSCNHGTDQRSNVRIYDYTVQLEQVVLKGNCFGVYGYHAVVDRSTIVGARGIGILHPRIVTNSLIVGNGWGGVSVGAESETFIIANNTIVGNGSSGISITRFYAGPAAPYFIVNNIVAANKWYGIHSANGYLPGPFPPSPPFHYNLFYENEAGNYGENYADSDDTASTKVFNTAAEINALPGNAGNIVADPKFVNAAAEDFHLQGSSPAIDAGSNASAPSHDFDGNPRPLNGKGDGDCSKIVDIGAYEAPVPPIVEPQVKLCQRYVFEPIKWTVAGCLAVDCCPGCPGLAVLDWRIYVIGPPMEAVMLRFEGLTPAAAQQIGIEGQGRWIAANRLLMAGRELTLRGLQFPRSAAESVRMTVESFSDDQPLTGALAVGISQSVAGRAIDETVLEYPAMPR